MKSDDPFSLIVECAQSGDEAAMAELFDAFFEKIFQYTARRVDENQVAEDITSDVFLDIVHQLKKFQGRSTFSTWIFQITKNKIADYWREKYALPTVPLEEFHLPRGTDQEQSKEDFERAEKQWLKLHILVIQCLDHLSETPRELLKLRFLQNYTLEEAAEELKMTKNTAKVTQFRALKRLRELALQQKISYS